MSDQMHYHHMEVNPRHPELQAFVASLPLRFERKEGEVVYKGRNELRRMEYEGKSYVVKSFRKPNLVNRLVYGRFRDSKAKRAFRNGLELAAIGVPNPLPIGYVEVRKGVFFAESYLVTDFSDCPYTWNDLFYKEFACTEQVAREVGKVTALLHEHGLAHKDYGRGNILFKEADGKVHIELVDLNRMYRGKMDMEKGCKNFERLPATPDMHRWIAEEYAKARGFDAGECFRLMQAYRSVQPGKIDDKY